MIRYPKNQSKKPPSETEKQFWIQNILKNLEDARGKPGKKWNPSKWFHHPFKAWKIVGPDKKIAATEPRGGFVLARVDLPKFIPPG